MTALNKENPVFVTCKITASITVLKIMGQGWLKVHRMLKSDSGLASPEDLQVGLINRNPRPEQLDNTVNCASGDTLQPMRIIPSSYP